MNYRIIDYPHFVSESEYRNTLDAMVKRLAQLSETISVYQIGSIGSPGISDLDMVVVFKDNEKIEKNLLENLSPEEKYLFVHNLYGISQSYFAECSVFTFFNNFTLLYGPDTQSQLPLSPKDTEILKQQIAIEYIVRMCITIYLQKSYRVLRVRDLLLHVKALQYDCEFLGISAGKLVEKISQVIQWRKNWFNKTPSSKEIIIWWNEFYEEFELFAKSLFGTHKFYLPFKKSYSITNNISIVSSKNKVNFSREGFVLPSLLSFMGKRYFRLQNKLNKYRFDFPITFAEIPPVLENKFKFEKKYAEYNRKFLPHFFTLTMNLHAN